MKKVRKVFAFVMITFVICYTMWGDYEKFKKDFICNGANGVLNWELCLVGVDDWILNTRPQYEYECDSVDEDIKTRLGFLLESCFYSLKGLREWEDSLSDKNKKVFSDLIENYLDHIMFTVTQILEDTKNYPLKIDPDTNKLIPKKSVDCFYMTAVDAIHLYEEYLGKRNYQGKIRLRENCFEEELYSCESLEERAIDLALKGFIDFSKGFRYDYLNKVIIDIFYKYLGEINTNYLKSKGYLRIPLYVWLYGPDSSDYLTKLEDIILEDENKDLFYITGYYDHNNIHTKKCKVNFGHVFKTPIGTLDLKTLKTVNNFK